MNWIRAFCDRWKYRGLTLLLAAIAVGGALGTPPLPQYIFPELYYENQLYWVGRQLIYAQRDTANANAALQLMKLMLQQPQGERMAGLSDESLQTSIRKMTAQQQRAAEKTNLLRFKVERIERLRAQTLGVSRTPEPVEGF
ncbi:hypothetical protein [Megalodesulfovibrio paquesii]